MMKKKLMLMIGIMLFISLLSACNGKEITNEEEQAAEIAVEVSEVVKDNLIVERKVNGRTIAANLTPIIVQMPGEIEAIKVAAGDHVEKNDVIATIKTQAGNQTIKAPASGELVEFSQKEGNFVTETDPIAMIAHMDEIVINIAVTSNVRALFKKDEKVRTVIEGQELEAVIDVIGKMPNETGLYPIQATVINHDGNIIPGLIASLYVPEEQMKEAMIVPTAAIVNEEDGSFVYIVKDHQAKKVAVEIKITQTDQTAIEGEVYAGDRVVMNGQLTLVDGSKVNVVKEGE